MTTQPHILVVGADPLLAEEFSAAASALRNYQPVVRYIEDFHQAADAARSWRPHVALVEMSADLHALQHLVRELQLRAPDTKVVGVFQPDVFHHHANESTLLIEAVRTGVQDFLRRPLSSSDLANLLERLLQAGSREPVRWGKIVSFISNKGGVGKSTLAVNAACSLAKQFPEQVLLIDASLQIGTCANLLDLRPGTSLTDVARQRERLDETLIRQLAVPHHTGLHLLSAPANAIEGVEVTDEVLSRLLTLARHTYQYVLVDTFPVIDRVTMTILDLSDLIYLVVENVVPTLLAVSKIVDLMGGLNMPSERQRLILNRYQRVTGNPRQAEVSQRLGRAIDHTIGYDRRVITSANVGEPFVLRAGRLNSARRSMERIVAEIIELDTNRPEFSQSPASQNGHAKIAQSQPIES
jgi:pilus assembly protein CpaE